MSTLLEARQQGHAYPVVVGPACRRIAGFTKGRDRIALVTCARVLATPQGRRIAAALARAAPLAATVVLPDGERGKTLAVVAGLKRDINVYIAECMSQALQKNSTLVVTPSGQVAKAIPGYPLNIQGPYSAAYFDIEADYTKTDMEKIREIQKRLRVDYLYVIWVPTGSTLEKKIVFTDIISQLFEAPQSREVGRGWFWSRAGRSTGWFAPTPKREDVEQSVGPGRPASRL